MKSFHHDLRRLLTASGLSLVLAPLVAPTSALAQSGQSAQPAPAAASDMPSAAEIEARMRALRQQGQASMPSDEQLRRATQSAPAVPNIDALPTGEGGPAVDLSELASRFERLRSGPNASAGANGEGEAGNDGASTKAVSGLLVFVSMGMPVASLEALVVSAEKTGALLVLRGLKDHSLKATKLWIAQLIGKRRVAWRIDPTLYRSLDVQAVPTYVLIDPAQPMQQPCQSAMCGQVAHSRLAGDVTMQRALATMADNDPAFEGTAGVYLRRLSHQVQQGQLGQQGQQGGTGGRP